MQLSPASAEVANQQRLAAIELQRERVRELERRVQQRKLDDAARQAEVEREPSEGSDLRGRVRELNRRTQQHILDVATARRLGMQKVKEQEDVARGEKARLDSLASVEHSRKVWRLQEDARVKQRRLRDEAGIRVGGAYKRPAPTQQASDSSAKMRLVRVDGRRVR